MKQSSLITVIKLKEILRVLFLCLANKQFNCTHAAYLQVYFS